LPARSDLRGALIVAAMVAVGAIISMIAQLTVAVASDDAAADDSGNAADGFICFGSEGPAMTRDEQR